MSKAGDASSGVHRGAPSAYDDPGTPEEITRRRFMANATLAIGGVIGLSLAIPIVGSLIPDANSKGIWSPLDAKEYALLDSATSTPVKLDFTLKGKDNYLPEQDSPEYVWGIKVDPAKFEAKRPNLFKKGSPAGVPYEVITMNFVIMSPICPHLGCRFNWNSSANKFLCPCHGSQFNFDGTHEAGPAPRGLDPLPLRDRNGKADVMWIHYRSTTPDRIVISYLA